MTQQMSWKLQATIGVIHHYGPERVVVVVEGGRVARAVDPDRALIEYGIVPDVVLIRDDLWSLGARLVDLDAARALWAGKWIAEVNC